MPSLSPTVRFKNRIVQPQPNTPNEFHGNDIFEHDGKPMIYVKSETHTAGSQSIIKVSGHQYMWLEGDYNLEIGHFLKWLAWWLPGG